MDQPFIFEIKAGSKRYRLEFSDTSSPENWRTLDPTAVVVCYDISQRLSLINMQRYVSFAPFVDDTCGHKQLTEPPWQWLPEVKKAFQKIDVMPVIVLGLKRDLRSTKDPNGLILPNEAYQVAQEMRADRYVECSAVTGELLKLAFEDLCKTAIVPMAGQMGSEGLMSVGCSVM